MTSIFDTAWKVGNPYALAAFLGVLILALIVLWTRRRRSGRATDRRDADSISLVVKLLFGLAAVALLGPLGRCASNNSGQSNSALFNSGTMSNTSFEAR